MKTLTYLSLWLALVACSPSQTTPPTDNYSGNLVVNGDAEQSGAPDTPKAPLANLTGWTQGTSLESVTISGPRAQERSNKSQMLPYEKTGTLPVGTVKARIKLSFTREFGTWNEGFADNISLKVRLQ